MARWLYKARDASSRNDARRATLEETRDFATIDGLLARSARSSNGNWIANVKHVTVGDLIHIFYRQTTNPAGVHLLGSFRVKNPGAARLDPECALAQITDRTLAARLRAAYDARGPMTGWLLARVQTTTPSLDDDEVIRFLSGQATLVRYPRA